MTEQRLLWLDLETTGLEVHGEAILAAGVIVTDRYLKEIARAEWHVRPRLRRGETSTNWETWCEPKALEMHRASGLLKRCEASPFNLGEVTTILKAFILQHAGVKPYLSGNSIHFDRSMLVAGMPGIVDLLHHRQLDVSTIRVVGELWNAPSAPGGKVAHTPLADLEASIRQLRYYAHNYFGGGLVPKEVVTPYVLASDETSQANDWVTG